MSASWFFVCLKTCALCCLGDASLHLNFAICGVGVGPPTAFRRNGPNVPWVSLAGTHWGDDSSRVMSHQSANPCRVSGHCRDRGRDRRVDMSCGRRSYTHSSSTPPRLVKSGC